ncbi:peptidoglycan-binding protein [Streptomyces sp. NPDC088745]|uniref:peptidoglycan-binding domain-containing protein n=1 Tax=Streptomyces sp. NPDC088745 TaxID=3365884 RepID=UPI0038202A09
MTSRGNAMNPIRTRAARLAALLGGVGPALTAMTAPASAADVIKQGYEGYEVACVQRGVNIVQNPNVAVDSDFGPATRAAVVRHRKAERISADGQVGPTTGSHLISDVQSIRQNDIRSGGTGVFCPDWLRDCTGSIPHRAGHVPGAGPSRDRH